MMEESGNSKTSSRSVSSSPGLVDRPGEESTRNIRRAPSPVPSVSGSSTASRRRRTPLPIPPKSPRRYDSQSSSRSSPVPPVPSSPSGSQRMLTASPSSSFDPYFRSSSSASSHASTIPASPSDESAPPTPPAKDGSNDASSPRRYQQHTEKTSMVPMRSPSAAASTSFLPLRPRTAPRMRTQDSPSSLPGSPARSPAAVSRSSYLQTSTSSPQSRPESFMSNGSRTRTSFATTSGPFDYDTPASEREERQLEKDFMAAIERRRSSNPPDASFSDRFSMPATARSGETFSVNRRLSTVSREEQISPTTPTFPKQSQQQQQSPRRGESLRIDTTENNIFRGSRYASTDSSTWSIPVTRASPVVPSSDGGKSLVEEFQSRWSLSTADVDPPSTLDEESDEPSSPYRYSDSPRRDSVQSASRRRKARVFSNAGSSDAGNDDTVTPRGSVSNQGTAATDSVYSSAGTMRESYPHPTRPALSAVSESNGSPLSRLRQPSQLSCASRSSTHSSTGSFNTPMSELPEGSDTENAFFGPGRPLYQHVRQSIGSPLSERELSLDGESLPATPASEASEGFPGSLSSASLITDTESVTSSSRFEPEMSHAEKMAYKRERTVQELVETERIFAQDMAIARDIWLARARGKELGEIMTQLRSGGLGRPEAPSSEAGDDTASESGDFPALTTAPRFERRMDSGAGQVRHLAIAPPMMKASSQTSNKSMKGFTNPFSITTKSAQQARLSHSAGPTGTPDSRRAGSYPGLSSSASPRPSTGSIAGRPFSQSVNHGSALNAPMSPSDIKAIFANLEEIAGFSDTFLAVLEASGSNNDEDSNEPGFDKYGEAFNNMLPRLEQVYSLYCSKFDSAIARYESIADTLRDYSSECKELSQGLTNAWDLPSLLIKPVQRCLKYPLFIQSLIGLTADDHPDKASLLSASTGILKVAEGINELKRRQEIVGRVVKGRVRSDSYVGSRRGSSTPQKPRSTSGENSISTSKLAKSVSSRFKKSSNKARSDPPPAHDAAFEALLASMESRQRAIYTFLVDAKDWAKSVRMMLVSLLQLSLVWKNVYTTVPGEPARDDKSSRTIDYFAAVVVKSIIEGPWHDLDQEMRRTITPKVSQLLDLFRNPRAVIAKRAQKLAECQEPPSVKQEKLAKESAAAYHALNAQLLEELPIFFHAVETFFTAIVGRFVAMQTGLQRVIAEKWLDFAQKTCGQLGQLDQSPDVTISAWWQLHKPIVKQLDTLKILAPDLLLDVVERARRSAMPAALRQRQPSNPPVPQSSSSELQLPPIVPLEPMISNSSSLYRIRKLSLTRRQSEPLASGSNEILPGTLAARPFSDMTPADPPPFIPRKMPSYGPAPGESPNRASTVSASSAASARSMAFSGRTASSTTSPSTPSLENLPPLWLGATVARHTSASPRSAVIRGHPYLDCEAGDIFDVLDEVQYEKHALVRKEGATGTIGWLPLHVLQKLE